MFKLTKVKILDNNWSLVPPKYEFTGPVSLVRGKIGSCEIEELSKVDHLRVGDQVMVRGEEHVKTSRIKKLVEVTQQYTLFETRTSLYRIERV